MLPCNLAGALAARKSYVDAASEVSSSYGIGLNESTAIGKISKWSSAHFLNKSSTGLTGLINSGATCYLNSLLQSLFWGFPEFRAAVFDFEFDENLHGVEDECLIRQLQILFAELQLS